VNDLAAYPCCVDPLTGVTTSWPVYRVDLSDAPLDIRPGAFAVLLLATVLLVTYFLRKDSASWV